MPKQFSGYIIDNNNIIKLSTENQGQVGQQALKGSVMLATTLAGQKVKFCSGVLIAGNPNPLVLANHHCFAQTDEEGVTTEALIPEACSETYVYLGFSELTNYQPEKIKCKDNTLKTDFVGDLSVFELESIPTFEFTTLDFWDGDPAAIDRQAEIVHYPAAKESFRVPPNESVPLPTTAITYEDCVVKGPFEKPEWGLDPALPHGIRHTCDLIKGSSGSALIDRETQKILGINWGGIKLKTHNGSRVDNVATWVPYIKAFLEGKSESIQIARQNELDASVKDQKQKTSTEKQLASKVEKTFCGSLGRPVQNKNWLWILMAPLIAGLTNLILPGRKST